MKKGICLLILCLICLNAYAGIFDKEFDTRGALTYYQPIYLLTGFTPQEQVKIQISLKYDLFYPINTGFYLGYTQIMFWDLWSLSGPFREINYNPEVFWKFESGNNFLGDISILFLDYFQIGMGHLSNGKDGTASRGLNELYAQIQFSFGDIVNAGINYKYFWLLDKTENQDIQDYIGSMTTKLFVKLRDTENSLDMEEIYFKFGFGGGVNGLDFMNGWQELGLKARTIFSRFRPFIYIYRGYAESIIEYNVSKEDLGLPQGVALKLGFIIE